MANVPPNDHNVDAPAIAPALVNPDHAPAQPVGLGNGFAPHWIGNNIPNNQNGWIEEDVKEEEEDPEEDPEKNNPPPLNLQDEETPTSLVIPDADGQPIPPIASFGKNFHFDESSSTANLLTGNSKIVPTGPMCPNLGTVWKSEYMCRMLQNRQKYEGSFPLPLGLQVREPPVEPSARPVPAPYPDDPYVVTRD
nr:hypothetical protein [Tanacetum cinerariifolium]